MPAAADERCADSNISARNTVRTHRCLLRTGIPSYHRRRRQQMCSRKRVCISLLCCLRRFLLLSPANGGREGERSWLSHRCLKRQVGLFGSWNLTWVCCQCNSNSYGEAYNCASAISWLSCWTPVSLLGNWQADQFTCIISTPTLREAIMVKIVRIIIEFLWYTPFRWRNFARTYGL